MAQQAQIEPPPIVPVEQCRNDRQQQGGSDEPNRIEGERRERLHRILHDQEGAAPHHGDGEQAQVGDARTRYVYFYHDRLLF
ncbi:hypothetical protein D3C77_587210 [compost metagenome]